MPQNPRPSVTFAGVFGLGCRLLRPSCMPAWRNVPRTMLRLTGFIPLLALLVIFMMMLGWMLFRRLALLLGLMLMIVSMMKMLWVLGLVFTTIRYLFGHLSALKYGYATAVTATRILETSLGIPVTVFRDTRLQSSPWEFRLYLITARPRRLKVRSDQLWPGRAPPQVQPRVGMLP